MAACFPSSINDYARRARAYYAEGQYERALIEMNTYIAKLVRRAKVSPNQADKYLVAQAFAERATMHYNTGAFVAAISDLNEVIDLSSFYPASHVRGLSALRFRGMCFQALGDLQAAKSDFLCASQLDNWVERNIS